MSTATAPGSPGSSTCRPRANHRFIGLGVVRKLPQYDRPQVQTPVIRRSVTWSARNGSPCSRNPASMRADNPGRTSATSGPRLTPPPGPRDLSPYPQKEVAMPTFVILLNWTDQGIKSIKDSTSRADSAKELMGGLGVELKDVYW